MNRLPSQTSVTPVFGLVAWLEQTKIALPLKGVECRFDVTAGVASVEVDQVFHQNSPRPLDCTYTFPLPAGAAVYRCEMHVNGRLIRAKVEEQEKARRIYREQKAAGRRAALVETERENLFTLSLGNVQPGDVVIIRFAYFQLLERLADSLSVRIPVCPGVRYIPGKPLLRSLSGRGASDDTDEVPDASRISPPRIDALHPDAAYFAVAGRLALDDVAAGSLSSPSHPVLVHENGDSLELVLAENGAVPDRDFVVRWFEPKEAALIPRAWSLRTANETFALVQLRAPADAPVAANFSQDIYFLVDRSGSMAGAKWTKTCEALRAFVDVLGNEDRVWITLFESNFQDFAEKPLPATKVSADNGFVGLDKRGTGGGTELQPAAKHVLEKIKHHSADRRAVVVLITDGQVGNERDIAETFRARPGLTVFTFGIDTAVNDAFLRDLAKQTGGECWLQTPNDDIAGTIAKLAGRLRRPVLTNLRIAGDWESPAPRLPEVFAGQVVDLGLRLGVTSPAAIELTGVLADGREHRFSVALSATENSAIKLLWARERISALLAQSDSAGAIALAKAHNLVCEGAAFIAWDEAEQVTVAQEEVYQPSLECAFVGAASSAVLCAGFSTHEPRHAMRRFARFFSASPKQPRAILDNNDRLEEPTAAYEPSFQPKRADDEQARRRQIEQWRSSWMDRLCRLGIVPELAAVFVSWMIPEGEPERARQKLLETFLARIETESPDVRSRIRRCREFIELHLRATPSFHEQAIQRLDAWEAQLAI